MEVIIWKEDTEYITIHVKEGGNYIGMGAIFEGYFTCIIDTCKTNCKEKEGFNVL